MPTALEKHGIDWPMWDYGACFSVSTESMARFRGLKQINGQAQADLDVVKVVGLH